MAQKPTYKELELEYRTIFNNSTDLIFVINKDKCVISVNPQAARFLNKKAEEIIGKSIQLLFSKEISDDYSNSLNEVLSTGNSATYDNKIITQNREIWASTQLSPLKDSKGEVLAVIGISRDITERKQMEEDLKRAATGWQTTFNATNDVIWVLDKEHRVLQANKITERIFSRTPEAVIGKHCYEVIHGTREPVSECPILRAKKSLKRETMELNLGEEWFLVTVDPILDADNQYAGAVHIIKDITERKQAEERIQHLNLVLHTLRNINQLLIGEKNKDRLIQKACHSLIENRGYNSAWIVLFGEQGQYLKSVEAGLGKSFITTKKSLKNGKLPKCGDMALEKRDLVIIEDPNIECKDCPLSMNFIGSGHYTACLRHEDTIYGLLTVSVPNIFLKDDEEQDLFREISGDIGYALYNIEIEKKRRQAEEELKKSEEKYRLLAENVTDAIWTRNMDLKITYVSPSIERLTGYSVEEFLTLPLSKRTTPASFKLINSTFTEEMALEKQGDADPLRFRTIEVENYNKDGSTIWLEVVMSFLRDDKGKAVGILGVSRDITERKHTREALRNSEAQLSNAMEIAKLGYWEYDVVADMFTFNDHFYDIFRTTAEKVGGYKLSSEQYAKQFLHPDDMMKVGIETRKAIETTDPDFSRQLEHRIIYADGEIGYISVRFFIVKDSQGRTIKTFGANQDITDHKLVEKKLKESDARYRDLYEKAPVGYFSVNPNNGSIRECNMTASNLLGYEQEVLVKMDVLDLYADTSNGKVKAKDILKIVHSGQSINDLEMEMKHKDGHSIWVSLSVEPVKDQKGVVYESRSVVIDISERKHLEDQFLQSQKMEAIGRLAGGIAHDFNNVLTVIIGYSELILNSFDKDHPLYDGMKQIRNAAERATSMVTQILAFSRKQVYQPVILDINETIKSLDNMLARLIGEDIDLKILLEPGPCNALMDPGQVEQVIMNLVVNARDAMPEGGSLTITTVNMNLDKNYFVDHGITNSPGLYVILSVSDTGTGMDKETLSHIFEPFYTTKGKEKGTGLGLSTVYGIIKQNRGYIWAYSEPGKGSTFKIFLPFIKGIEEVEEIELKPTRKLKGSETILLAEDDASVRKMTKTILQDYGYLVLEAVNGEDALKISRKYKGPIHLLLTDMIMPGMNGLELSKILQSQRSEMKVIYMSGYADDSLAPKGALDPKLTFLRKPFTQETLMPMIKKILGS